MKLKKILTNTIKTRLKTMTVTALANETGIRRETLSRLASESRTPKHEKMIEILILMGCDVTVHVMNKKFKIGKDEVKNDFINIKKEIGGFIEKKGLEVFSSLQAFSLSFSTKPNYVWASINDKRTLDALYDIANRLPDRPKFFVDGVEVEFHEAGVGRHGQ